MSYSAFYNHSKDALGQPQCSAGVSASEIRDRLRTMIQSEAKPSAAGKQTAPGVAAHDYGESDAFTGAEIDCFRVVEFEGVVSLSTVVGTEGQMQLLCDSCFAKVFPNHVVFSRTATNSPVAELVIQELCELTEDTARNTLSFMLSKPNGTTVIEVGCDHPAVLSSLYKLVCAKRNKLESP